MHSLRNPIVQWLSLVVCCLLISHSQTSVAARCPRLTILFDASGSMQANPMGPGNIKETDPTKRKFTIAANATNAFAKAYESQIQLGMALFPSNGMCGAASLSIPPALYNAAKISDLLGRGEPTSFLPDSPTSASITSVADQLRSAGTATAPTALNYLLLLTDGQPQCFNNPNETPQTAVTAISNVRAGTPSLPTFVIGLGQLNAEEQAALNQMAIAGGQENTSGGATRYFAAPGANELSGSLQQIAERIRVEAGGFDCSNQAPDPCARVSCWEGQVCVSSGPNAGTCQEAPLPPGMGAVEPGCSCRVSSASTLPQPLLAIGLALLGLGLAWPRHLARSRRA
jgi:hypothetical protein